MATSFASLPKERPKTKCFWRLVYSVLVWMHFRCFAGGAKCGRGWSEHGDSVPLLPWKPGVFSFYCLPLLPWKPGVFSFYCLPLLPCEPDVFSFYCLPLLPWNQVYSVFTVYHFCLENQVCSKPGVFSCNCLPLLPWKPGVFKTVILTHAVQVSLCGPSEDELRCTQSHSTVGSGLCRAGIAVRAIRGWNWGVLSVLSHTVPVMLTYVVQVLLCMPSEGGIEVYSVMQYQWCWLMLCRYCCACHQRVELRCT